MALKEFVNQSAGLEPVELLDPGAKHLFGEVFDFTFIEGVLANDLLDQLALFVGLPLLCRPVERFNSEARSSPPNSAPTMSNLFFDHPILNSPYECPARHWESDSLGQPTQQIRGCVGIWRNLPSPSQWQITPRTQHLPGGSHLGTHGRAAFTEFWAVYAVQSHFATKMESHFNKMIEMLPDHE